ncbi:hypothetical protein ACFW93_32545 [Streptomyces canus]|uniref:hypothetical protein n=1 Tax=Streptomyces canus TaxID=58343 RepID=UPI0036B34C8D
MAEDAEAQRLAEDARIWEHMLHEHGTTFEQGNLFLVGQSLFAVAYTTLLASGRHIGATRLIAGFGLAMAATWLYVCHRQFSYFRIVQERAHRRLPEYAATRESWNRRPIALRLITYFLPAAAAVLWAFLLVIS